MRGLTCLSDVHKQRCVMTSLQGITAVAQAEKKQENNDDGKTVIVSIKRDVPQRGRKSCS